MSRPKKSTPRAQANSGLSTEAVLKLPPRTFSTPLTEVPKDGGPTDKDGNDGTPPEVFNYVIEVALNGFFLVITYNDPEMPDERYVFQSLDEVIQCLKDTF